MGDDMASTGDPGRPDARLLAEIIRRVVEVVHPDRIVLFGSAARGALGPDSDYDLLVVKTGVRHRRRLAQEIHLNLFGVGVPVDILVVTPEDLNAFRDKVGSIIGPALREGREVSMPPATRDPSSPREWLGRARSNLARARAPRPTPDVLYEDLCFDAQQAAEKAINAVCVHRNVAFPKTHDIVDLLTLLPQGGIDVPDAIRQADRLTGYAVESRYPGIAEDVTADDYTEAVALAEQVVRWAESRVAQRGET